MTCQDCLHKGYSASVVPGLCKGCETQQTEELGQTSGEGEAVMTTLARNPGILLSNGKYTTGSQGEYIRKARKPYQCEACNGSIQPGDFYIWVANPRGYYGQLQRRSHLVCPDPRGN